MSAAAAPGTETASGLAARFALRVPKRPVEEAIGSASSTAGQTRLQVAAAPQESVYAAAGGFSAMRDASEEGVGCEPSLASRFAARFAKTGGKSLQQVEGSSSRPGSSSSSGEGQQMRAAGGLTPGQAPV
eukprot:6745919-Prymnesium_polylepis.1